MEIGQGGNLHVNVSPENSFKTTRLWKSALKNNTCYELAPLLPPSGLKLLYQMSL